MASQWGRGGYTIHLFIPKIPVACRYSKGQMCKNRANAHGKLVSCLNLLKLIF